MTDRITSEMLMAFVDGELDHDTREGVARAIAADPSLRAEAEGFRRSRELARQLFADVREEPVPDRLAAAVHAAANAYAHGAKDAEEAPARNVVPFRRRAAGFAPARLAWAAGLVLCLGVGFIAGRAGGPAALGDGFVGGGALAEALGQTAGGEVETVRLAGGEAQLTTRASYPAADGLCRSFELKAPEGRVLGVGCERGGSWQVELALSERAGAVGEDASYAPASGAGLAAIDAYLDTLEAGPSLPAGQ